MEVGNGGLVLPWSYSITMSICGSWYCHQVWLLTWEGCRLAGGLDCCRSCKVGVTASQHEWIHVAFLCFLFVSIFGFWVWFYLPVPNIVVGSLIFCVNCCSKLHFLVYMIFLVLHVVLVMLTSYEPSPPLLFTLVKLSMCARLNSYQLK